MANPTGAKEDGAPPSSGMRNVPSCETEGPSWLSKTISPVSVVSNPRSSLGPLVAGRRRVLGSHTAIQPQTSNGDGHAEVSKLQVTPQRRLPPANPSETQLAPPRSVPSHSSCATPPSVPSGHASRTPLPQSEPQTADATSPREHVNAPASPYSRAIGALAFPTASGGADSWDAVGTGGAARPVEASSDSTSPGPGGASTSPASPAPGLDAVEAVKPPHWTAHRSTASTTAGSNDERCAMARSPHRETLSLVAIRGHDASVALCSHPPVERRTLRDLSVVGWHILAQRSARPQRANHHSEVTGPLWQRANHDSSRTGRLLQRTERD